MKDEMVSSIDRKRILFVCNVNRQRSPTAEELFKQNKTYVAKSCGVWECKKQINQKLVDWADIVFVMENHQKYLITRNYHHKKVINLDIPDNYVKNEIELINVIKKRLIKHKIKI